MFIQKQVSKQTKPQDLSQTTEHIDNLSMEGFWNLEFFLHISTYGIEE